jgi:hypothetical protein
MMRVDPKRAKIIEDDDCECGSAHVVHYDDPIGKHPLCTFVSSCVGGIKSGEVTYVLDAVLRTAIGGCKAGESVHRVDLVSEEGLVEVYRTYGEWYNGESSGKSLVTLVVVDAAKAARDALSLKALRGYYEYSSSSARACENTNEHIGDMPASEYERAFGFPKPGRGGNVGPAGAVHGAIAGWWKPRVVASEK